MYSPKAKGHETAPAAATPSLLVTPEQAAEALHVSRALMFQMLARGDIFSVKVGRLRRIPLTALQSYVERLMEAEGWQEWNA